MKLFFISILIFSFSVMADTAKFCMTLTSIDSLTEQPMGPKAQCLVYQTLRVGDSSNMWQCKFSNQNGVVKQLFNFTTIGFNYLKDVAFVSYDFQAGSNLMTYLLSNLGFNIISSSARELKVSFYDERPIAENDIFFYDLKNDLLVLKISNISYAQNVNCFE